MENQTQIKVTLGNASFMVYGLSVVYLFACFCLALVMAVNMENANYWYLANLAWGVFFFAILIRWVLLNITPIESHNGPSYNPL